MRSPATKKPKYERLACNDPSVAPADIVERDVARLASLEAEIQAQRSRLARQEGLVDALTARKPDRLGPIISAGGAAVSSTVAVGGFFAVHYFSVRRQRRDEFFKRVQDCLTILDRIGRDASKVWKRPGKDKEAQAALEFLQTDIDALTYRLGRMQQLQKKFDVTEALVELKREATLNVEDHARVVDVSRADRALRLAQNLAKAILAQYDQVYG